MRFVFALLLLASILPSHATSGDVRYFLGEIEFEINGESVKYTRAWRCELTTVFRPAFKELFEQQLRQVAPPKDGFVVKRFGTDHVIVFEDWQGCGTERRWHGDSTRASVIDSIASPKYGERLYLKVGAPTTVLNPFEKRFRVRLLKERTSETDRATFEKAASRVEDVGSALLYQLRLNAAFRLHVDVLTWNEVDKMGLRRGLALNQSIWEVDRLAAPPTGKPAADEVDDRVFIPLPLGYVRKDGKRGPPFGMGVRYAGRVIELDERGFAQIQQPETGIRLVRFYAEVDDSLWARQCTVHAGPQCPQLPLAASGAASSSSP